MITRIFPYVPSVEKIMLAFTSLMDTFKTGDVITDPYEKFVIAQGMFVDDSPYVVSDEWAFMALNDREVKLQKLEEKLMSYPICKTVSSLLKKSDRPYKDVVSELESDYREEDLRVVISWMQHFGHVRANDGILHYSVVQLDKTDEPLDGVYPLDNIAEELDIREDKISVFDYFKLISDHKIVIPDFQRKTVWKDDKMSAFIESIIMNLPLPPIYLKKSVDGNYYLVDGLQRTTTLAIFISDKLKLRDLKALPQLNGYNYKRLKENPTLSPLATRVVTKKLNFYVLQPSVPMSIVYDLFNRINTGGSHLSRQEIRNCIFIGHSTKLLENLSKEKCFQEAVGYGIPTLRMKDREAILRCLAFRLLDPDTYKGSLDEYMERAMRKINHMSEIEVDDMEKEFISIMNLTNSIYAAKNYRIPSKQTKGRINIAVMETVYYAFAMMGDMSIATDKKKLNEAFAAMLKNREYIDSCRNSTNDKSKVDCRFRIAMNYLCKNKE